MDVVSETGPMHLDTLYDELNAYCRMPSRRVSAPMGMFISGLYKIGGVGNVFAGHVEQNQVKLHEEFALLPRHLRLVHSALVRWHRYGPSSFYAYVGSASWIVTPQAT